MILAARAPRPCQRSSPCSLLQSPNPAYSARRDTPGMRNSMTPQQYIRFQQRRTFLGQATRGVGALALASLLNPSLLRASEAVVKSSAPDARKGSGAINPLHFAPKAKRVIVLGMAGGPSHLETFDYKPKLAEMGGKGMPESFTKGQPIAQLQGQSLKCFAPQHAFKKFGKSGQEICELFPKIGSMADD